MSKTNTMCEGNSKAMYWGENYDVRRQHFDILLNDAFSDFDFDFYFLFHFRSLSYQNGLGNTL